MRRENHIFKLQKLFFDLWFIFKDIDRSPPNNAVFERLRESKFIDNRTARGIDKICRAFHELEVLRVHKMACFRQKRHVDTHKVRIGQKLVNGFIKFSAIILFKLFVSLYIIINYFRPKTAGGVMRDKRPNPPETDNTNGFPRKIGSQKKHWPPSLIFMRS